MANTATAADDSGSPSLIGRILRLVGLLAICAVALIGGLVAATGPEEALEFVTSGIAPKPETAPQETAPHGPHVQSGMTVTPFKEIIVNITATTMSGRKTSRFLKLNIALVYDGSMPGAGNIEERKLFIRDAYQDYLRLLNDTDLQGSIGLARLKSELLRRTRAITDSDAPQELLIADLLVQ